MVPEVSLKLSPGGVADDHGRRLRCSMSGGGRARAHPSVSPSKALSIQLSDEKLAGSVLLVINLPPSQLDRSVLEEFQGVKCNTNKKIS